MQSINQSNIISSDGEAKYFPGFLDSEASLNGLHQLIEETPWKQEPIILFGKKIMQPRMTAWYGDENSKYRYSGIDLVPLAWTPLLLSLKEKIERHCGWDFNSVLLNYYRDGQDSMGLHRDNEKSLGVQPKIASLSLGAPRKFQFRHIQTNEKVEVLLSSGSLLLMHGELQNFWKHGLPKDKNCHSARVNLTFRKIV